jgi:hypothetical protein
MKTLLWVLLLAIAITASAQSVLTNESILKLVKSGIGDDLIVNMIQSQQGNYTLTPDEVVKLKHEGVPESVMTAMAKKTSTGQASSTGGTKIALKTPVRLSVEESLSSKSAKAGDTFKLVVTDDVAINGHVVIAKGAPATGRIITSEKKSFAIRNGTLEVAIDSAKAVGGQTVALDGHLSVGGGGVGPGHFGHEVEIKQGEIINAVVAAESDIKM